MNKKLFAILMVVALFLSACSVLPVSLNIVTGSGNVTSETRNVNGFTGIDLRGSADVDVAFGEAESAVVEAEDNIIPLIETRVQNGQLVIDSKSNTSYTTTKSVRVHVTMKSLEAVSLGGSGSVSAQNLQSNAITLDLAGSGNINLSGTVNSAEIVLGGSGRLNCEQLKANAVKVNVTGSGNANVYASDELDASISGSGNIRYRGNPTQINKTITGSGNISSN